MKYKKLIPVLLIILLLTGLGCLAGRGQFVWVDEVRYEKKTESLDLTGGLPKELAVLKEFSNVKTLDIRGTKTSADTYDVLKSWFPDAEILWEIPFQGEYYPMTTECLSVTELSETDLGILGYFTQLRQIDAASCGEYAMLSELRARYPQLVVDYEIRIGGEAFAYSADQLVLTDVDVKQLETVLTFFEKLSKVTLEGVLPAAEDLYRLREQYPEVEFYWQVTVLGQTADIATTELDFSGMPLDSTAEIEAAAAYLPNLEKVLMLDCGLTNEQMTQLNERHSDVLFVWNVKLGQGMVLRSDATVFAPVLENRKVYDRDLKNLRYCTELVLIDLGHMEITDVSFLEYMPEVRFLILADTCVTDLTPLSGLKKLQFLELFISPIRDYSPLVGCTALEQLNISGTFADPTPLMQMTWLKRLWHVMRYMTPEQRSALIEALPNTLVQTPTHGSTGGGWRDCDLYYEMRDMMGLPYMVD